MPTCRPSSTSQGIFFLEVQTALAAEIAYTAAVHGADTLTEGERGILADTQALMSWFGLEDLNAWDNLDFERGRCYHEQFARRFEAYLFAGKAPSIELQDMIQRFDAQNYSVQRRGDPARLP